MRTIGIKNQKEVVKITEDLIKQTKFENYKDFESWVVSFLPMKLWEVWEGADNEIRGLIGSAVAKMIDDGFKPSWSKF